jgi:hypothetical protein
VALVWRKGAALETTIKAVGETLRSAYGALIARAARAARS